MARCVVGKAALFKTCLLQLALGVLLLAGSAQAVQPTLTTLHSFATAEGTNPYDGPALLADGTIFGPCYNGGDTSGGKGGGTLFKLQPDGSSFSVMHTFGTILSGGTANTGGSRPFTAPVPASDGFLYGMTSNGGTVGYGTFYKIKPDATGFVLLKSFDADQANSPEYTGYGMVLGNDGYFYGNGGDGGNVDTIVFKINATGTVIKGVKSFTHGSTDGGIIGGQLLSGADGKIYGLTEADSYGSASTIFSVNTDGTGFTVLHTFSAADGQYPYGGLNQGPDGMLYGMTNTGYVAASKGTVFKIKPDGSGYTVLRTLTNATEGGASYGRLLLAADGLLYGASAFGGSSGLGTLFSISTTGTNFTVLHTFTGGTDHAYPNGSMVQASDGRIFGTASDTDPNYVYVGNGSVFVFSPAVATPPTVTAITPTSGTTAGGRSVTITGTNLTGATGVTLGGTAATGITVVNATTITCTTPAHAAGTASVVVTTPGGSNGANTLFTYIAQVAISSLTRVTATPTNATTVSWTLTFASAVTGLTSSNLALTGAAATGASVGTPTTSNGGLTWTVPVTTGATDGAVTLRVANATGLSAGISTTLPFDGDTITMDKTQPSVVSVVRLTPTGQTTNLTSVTFRVTYSEAVTLPAPTTNRFAVVAINGGTTTGTVASVTGSGTTRDVTVNVTGGSGEFRLRAVD